MLILWKWIRSGVSLFLKTCDSSSASKAENSQWQDKAIISKCGLQQTGKRKWISSRMYKPMNSASPHLIFQEIRCKGDPCGRSLLDNHRGYPHVYEHTAFICTLQRDYTRVATQKWWTLR